MPLPLPYTLGDDEDPIQGNFDELKKQFPLGRRHMKIEKPHVVGAADEPAFQNGWVNFDTSAWQGARFWKDPMGVVHIEGLIKSGTLNQTAFILPAGYRPGNGHVAVTIANGVIGRLDIAPTGNVIPVSGSNVYFSLFVPPFKQEQ